MSPPSPCPPPYWLNLGAREARYSALCHHRGPARRAEGVGGCLVGRAAAPPPTSPHIPPAIPTNLRRHLDALRAMRTNLRRPRRLIPLPRARQLRLIPLDQLLHPPRIALRMPVTLQRIR